MTLVLPLVTILLVLNLRCAQAQPPNNYRAPTGNNQPQYVGSLLQPYNHNNNDAFSHQSQTRYQPTTNFNSHHEPLLTRTLTQMQIPTNNLRWSGAPIFVDYEDDYADQNQQRWFSQSNSRRPAAQPTHIPPTIFDRFQSRDRTQSALEQSDSRNALEAFPATAQIQNQHQPHQLNYYQNQQQQYSYPNGDNFPGPIHNTNWPSPASPIRHDYARDLASHFERYVRKYPRRLQPRYEPSAVYYK